MDSRGESILCGGKVVKNVAGYDMTRLMAGSAGTLGFITQVTLRVAMLPERWAALAGEGTLKACADAAAAILSSNIAPVFVAALPVAAEESGPGAADWTLLCGCEGFGQVIDDQLARIAMLYREMGLGHPVSKAYDIYEGCFREAYGHMRRLPFVMRADLPPDAVAGFMEELAGPRAAFPCVLDWGCGRIWLAMEDLGDKDWLRMCNLAASCRGHVVLVQASEAFKQRHDVFGPPRPEWRIMHRIKAELDPLSIFSPGHLPGRV
jgi:FAD/FMN-containing dehydrogenase